MQVSEGYFDALGVKMRQGRALRDTDGKQGSEGVVVNARFRVTVSSRRGPARANASA